MSVQIAWGITGASHFLKETFDVMNRVVEPNRIKVATYLSSAGVQVVKMCGFWNKLEQISSGGYLQEVFTETEEGPSFPHAGRFNRGIYKALIVSPASGNTVAKIVHGIADTLVTNAIAQAQKEKFQFTSCLQTSKEVSLKPRCRTVLSEASANCANHVQLLVYAIILPCEF
jgi:dihydromethanopterin reductase (acceptor)